jgi:ketosteroid isomerase-like protein
MLINASSFVFSQSNDEQPVLQTLNQMAVALRTNNTEALDKLYANDYTSVSPRGFLISKASRLESIKSGYFRYESFDYQDVKVRFYGNAAVVNATIRVKIKGEDGVTVLATLILTKNEEHWQVVAAQSTNILK